MKKIITVCDTQSRLRNDFVQDIAKLFFTSLLFILFQFNVHGQSVFGSWVEASSPAATSPTTGITASPSTGSGAFDPSNTGYANGGIWCDASGSTTRVLSDYWEYKITTDANTTAIVTSFTLNRREYSGDVTMALYYSTDGVTFTQAGSNVSTNSSTWTAMGSSGLNIVMNVSTSFYLRFYGWYDGVGAVYNQQVKISGTIGPNCTAPCLTWLNQSCTTCTNGCYINGGLVAPTPALQTASTATTSTNYGYVYWSFNASADSTYYFDLCSSTGTAGVSWLRLHNARITGNNYCTDTINTPTLVLQNNPNGCTGTGVGLSKLIWTCQTSGTYYLESAVGSNMIYWGVTGNQTATLSYKTLPSFSYTCSDVFYDKGIDGTNGSTMDYNNDEDWNYTYFPTDTVHDVIHAQFISFSVQPGDVLCVYNGNSINAPLIGCYSGLSITGPVITSTASDGSLTFQFTSDDSLISSGWQVNVSCVAALGVGSYGLANKISIYPNPVKDMLEVSGLKYDANTKIQVFDVIGKSVSIQQPIVQSQNSQSKTMVDVSALSSGIYFIRIENATGEWNGRFVKQ